MKRTRGHRIAIAVADARRTEETLLLRNRFAAEDRRFAEIISELKASEERSLDWIRERSS